MENKNIVHKSDAVKKEKGITSMKHLAFIMETDPTVPANILPWDSHVIITQNEQNVLGGRSSDRF